jgi:amino acid adenylation domain-containing protein
MLILATTILAADTRSLDNLARWIAAAYNADANPQPALQYVQYADWKNENPGSSGLEPDPRQVESFGFELRRVFSESLLLGMWRALLERWRVKANVVVLDSKREFDELNELVGRFSNAPSGAGESFGFSFDQGASRKWKGKVAVSVWRRQSLAGPFKLMLQCEDRGDVLHLELQFDAARFSRTTIEDMAESYQLLLTATAPMKSLTIVGPRAQQRLLSFSRGLELDANPRRIDELFREQVTRNPQASAVVFEDEKLTYAELDAASDALAHYLIDQGAAIDTPIAIRLDRSLDLIVAIMGVLKSGAAYVPLDPTFPEPRMQQILVDCGAKIIVTPESLRTQSSRSRARSIDHASSLAYIIYTSGSTGVPKGVCVEHRQVTHYVCALIDRHASLAGCSFASVSTIAADLGNTAIFTALLTGGCLHLISRERATDGAQFADYLATHDVDAIKIVPSHFSALTDSIDLKSVLPKRCVVFGGEALPRELANKVSGLTVINHYGPTETTIGTTTSHETSIGRPLPGTQAYVLDEYLQLMPHGVSGELFIGGNGVARGYCNRPDLTAEKFIPDPFTQRGGQRLYRTGDRARFNETGNLIFEGRRDRQVKIAGFRIELGEVEAALQAHGSVNEAVAIVERNQELFPTLIAYVASESNANELRAFLASRLPAHMIPAAIHTVSRLPLTPNGKLDQTALRERARSHPINEPTDPVAKQIRQICVDLTDNPDIDADDNLLDLGVSSLKAMQLLARLGAAFDVALPLSAIFEQPTVNGLAALVQDDLVRAIAQLPDEEVKQRIQAYQSK